MTLLNDRPAAAAPPPPPAAAPSWRSWRPSGRVVLTVLVVAILLYLVAGPLIMLVGSSFQDSSTGLPLSAGAEWTLENYSRVFGNDQTYTALGNTLIFAGGALAIAFTLAVLFAWLIERTDLPFPNASFVLLVAPSGMPFLIVSIAWSLLLNPTNGLINQLLDDWFGFTVNIYSMVGMIFVQGIGMVPITFLLVSAAIKGMSSSLEDAASTSGATLPQTLRRVTVPMMTPALLGAFVYLIVNVVDTLDVPLVLGLPGHEIVLSSQVYLTSRPPAGLPDYGAASVYGILMIGMVIVPLLIYNRLIGRANAYTTIGSRARHPKKIQLGVWRYPALGLLALYVLVGFALPFLILIWVSIQPFYEGISQAAFDRITFDGYRDIFSSGAVGEAFLNTLILGAAAGIAAVALATLTSWLIVRSRSRATWMLDLLAFMPHAFPGVAIGLSIALIYLVLPIPIYGTIWIVVIAMATQYVSLGTRLTTSGIVQIQETLEKAGATSGAAMRTVWRRILVPLLRPAFVNAFLLVFLASIQNLTLPLMLQSPDNIVASTLLWGHWDRGNVTSAAVLSVVMTIITVLAAGFLRNTTRKM
jgi:iron(III) transport system permease protein